MWDDFIAQQIRRTNRNLLLFGAAVLAILGTVMSLTWRDVYNFTFGPFPIQASELTAIWNPDSPKHYFLKIKGEKSFPTGMREVDRDNQSKVRAEVVALVVGTRLLLVKTPSDKHELQFTGTLEAIPPELRQLQPDSHPLFAKLAKYGTLQDVRARIDAEIRGEGGGEKFGAIQVTTNWLIHAGAYKTEVMASRDIAWAYPKVTKHYHSGIPTGKTYSSIIRDTKGQSIEVAGKKDAVPKLLESLQERMPWVWIGFSKELDALWRKDKPKFFQLIDQRRAQQAPAFR